MCHILWQCLLCMSASSSMSTLAGTLRAIQDPELIFPLHCTDGQHQSHGSAVKRPPQSAWCKFRAKMHGPDPTLLCASSVAMGSTFCSAIVEQHVTHTHLPTALSSRGSWPSCSESQQHPSQRAASLAAHMLIPAPSLMCRCGAAKAAGPAAGGAAASRGPSGHAEEGRHGEQTHRGAPAHAAPGGGGGRGGEAFRPSQAQIHCFGWVERHVPPARASVRGMHGESRRSGPAKQIQHCSKQMGCQAELGVCSWVLASGEPASPAQPQAALPQVDELACQW